MMAAEQHDPQQGWDPCPQGELGKMIQAGQARRRRKVVDRVAVVGAALMVFIAVGGFTLGLFTPEPTSGGPYGGLACVEVRQMLPNYIEGSLDADTHQRMAVHLDNCPACQRRHEELLQSVSNVAYSAILIASTAW